jgi:hypothetical protein
MGDYHIVMQTMITVTETLLPHLPAGHRVGDEIDVEYQVRWEGSFHFKDGDAIVEDVIYHHMDDEIDLTELAEIELDHDEIRIACADAYESFGDHEYNKFKEMQLD